VLVCKHSITKNISYRAVVVFDDDRRAVIDRSCVGRWLGDIIYQNVFVRNRGGWNDWTLPARWGHLQLLCDSALNTLMRLFHVAFCGGWARDEIARDSFG